MSSKFEDWLDVPPRVLEAPAPWLAPLYRTRLALMPRTVGRAWLTLRPRGTPTVGEAAMLETTPGGDEFGDPWWLRDLRPAQSALASRRAEAIGDPWWLRGL